MKIFIPLLCLASIIMAEPPVEDGYPAARSSHHHDHHDHPDHHEADQRSLSQEYGPPSDVGGYSRNAPSSEYGAPNARSGANRAQRRPTARVSFNQRFSSASSRSSSQGYPAASARSISQQYGAPEARSGISQEYGVPSARSPSQEYGVPSVVAARTLSTEYGPPEARSAPSEEYGTPSIIAARSNQHSHSPSSFRSSSSHEHSSSARSQFAPESHSSQGAFSARSNDVSQGYSASPFAARNSPSTSYDAPSSRALSSTYGAPSARTADSYTDDVSTTYGVPSARSNLKTSAIASSYAPASSRSSPSTSYLPASRSMPAEQYGAPAPESRDAGQGYTYPNARALEELLNQEPANYDFAYQIEDPESGGEFGHTESRQDNRAEGSYFVVLPDGTKQTVEYTADERGFRPRITMEPPAGTYDDNAQPLAREQGPY